MSLLLVVVALLTLPACASGDRTAGAGAGGGPGSSSASGAASGSGSGSASGTGTGTGTASSSPSTATSATAAPSAQLPRGGRTIFPANRVVAYYGGPDGPGLGVLGSDDPDTVAAQIEQRAASYAGFGRPVQPAMELIATVASPCTSSTPQCTRAISDAKIQRYLDAAHRHQLLLILDFQPGRGEFLPQVQAVEPFLTDPSVSVALDPEWKLGPNQVPTQVIGSSSAASINAVADYVSGIVTRDQLPDKLLVVHQFRLSMLPDREDIAPAAGLEEVIHADGFGGQSAKLATWNALAIPNPPFYTGFKLFLTQDTNLMTPAQTMALTPQPDLVTYQ